MKNLSVQIDEELFKAVKIKTATLDISLKEYIVNLIKADLKINNKKDDT